jgi:hypothetical protein
MYIRIDFKMLFVVQTIHHSTPRRMDSLWPLSVNVFVTATQQHLECHYKALFETPFICIIIQNVIEFWFRNTDVTNKNSLLHTGR